MPFDHDAVHCELACGPAADGEWHGWIAVTVPLAALRPLGLHPDQPTSTIVGPSPPRWWHAAGDRYAQARP
jgi:hypothetical protein